MHQSPLPGGLGTRIGEENQIATGTFNEPKRAASAKLPLDSRS